SDIIKVNDNSALKLSEGTLAFSFEADKVDGMHGLVSVTGGGSKLQSWIQNGKLYVKFQDSDETDRFAVNVKAHTDYDVQATFDGDKVALYVNDKLIGHESFDGDWTAAAPDVTIGGFNYTDSYAFDGTISDLAIFNEALTSN